MASLGGSADVMVGKVTFLPMRLEARPDAEPKGVVDHRNGIEDDVAVGGGDRRGLLAPQHSHDRFMGGGERVDPDGLEPLGPQNLGHLVGRRSPRSHR